MVFGPLYAVANLYAGATARDLRNAGKAAGTGEVRVECIFVPQFLSPGAKSWSYTQDHDKKYLLHSTYTPNSVKKCLR